MAINNSINNTVGGSNSGATNTFTVTNSSNTSSSVAHEVISVGGATAGDAFTTYTVTGVTNWSHGVDNSDSDNFILSASSALGTTNVMTMTTAGAVQVVLGDFTVGRFSSGGTVQSAVVNSSNTASSDAKFLVQQGGGSGGDAYIEFQQTGGSSFTLGNDTSAGKFVLSANASLGTSNVISVNPNGEINYPLQPAFLAYNSVTDSNVTGDATVYTILFDTVVFDQNSDYNGSTGIFTAPVTGRYFVSSTIQVSPTAGTTGGITFVSSNRTYEGQSLIATITGFNGRVYLQITSLIDMDAADTVKVTTQFDNGAKTTSVIGAANPLTYFSGYLTC